MRPHWLDRAYSRATHRGTIFREGWGDLALIERLSALTGAPPPVRPVSIDWASDVERGQLRVAEGTFRSPVDDGTLPPESLDARVWWVRPAGVPEETLPAVVLLAATGDEGPRRRMRILSRPLAARGVASLILENPFYGSRRPALQRRTELRRVSEMGAMFRTAIEEARSLLLWLRDRGHAAIGIAGISMGGQAAAIAAALAAFPVASAICLAPASGVGVYTEGVFRNACDWEALARETGSVEAAIERMRTALEHADLTRFPPPLRPDLAILVAARGDGYVSADSVRALHQHWAGSELRWVEGGHVAAFLFQSPSFVQAVHDGLGRSRT